MAGAPNKAFGVKLRSFLSDFSAKNFSTTDAQFRLLKVFGCFCIFLALINAFQSILVLRPMIHDGARYAFLLTHTMTCNYDGLQLRLISCLYQLPSLFYMNFSVQPQPLVSAYLFFGTIYLCLIIMFGALIRLCRSADTLILVLASWVLLIVPGSIFLVNAVPDTALLGLLLFLVLKSDLNNSSAIKRISILLLSFTLCFAHQYALIIFIGLGLYSIRHRIPLYSILFALCSSLLIWRITRVLEVSPGLAAINLNSFSQAISGLFHYPTNFLGTNSIVFLGLYALRFMNKGKTVILTTVLVISLYGVSIFLTPSLANLLKGETFAYKNFIIPFILLGLTFNWIFQRKKFGFLSSQFLSIIILLSISLVTVSYSDFRLSRQFVPTYQYLDSLLHTDHSRGCFIHKQSDFPADAANYLYSIPIVSIFIQNQRDVSALHYVQMNIPGLGADIFFPCQALAPDSIPVSAANDPSEPYWSIVIPSDSQKAFFNLNILGHPPQ